MKKNVVKQVAALAVGSPRKSSDFPSALGYCFFAVLPFTARGVSWTARGLTGLWDGGARVVGVDRAEDARYDNGRSRMERRMRSNDEVQ